MFRNWMTLLLAIVATAGIGSAQFQTHDADAGTRSDGGAVDEANGEDYEAGTCASAGGQTWGPLWPDFWRDSWRESGGVLETVHRIPKSDASISDADTSVLETQDENDDPVRVHWTVENHDSSPDGSDEIGIGDDGVLGLP